MVTGTPRPFYAVCALATSTILRTLQLAAIESVVPLLVPKRHYGRANGPRMLMTGTFVLAGPVLAYLLLKVFAPFTIVVVECLLVVVAMPPPDEPRRTEEQIRALSAALAAVNDVKALAAYNRAGTRELNSTDSAVAVIRVPTLGIIGSLDNVPSMNQLKRVLPSLELVVIDGATHVGDRGAPRRPEFVRAIRDFIDRKRAPTEPR